MEGFILKHILFIVCFLLGNSPASDLYMPTFWNTLSVPSSQAGVKMEQIECSETSAYINQTPGNYPKENTLYSEHGESLKSRKRTFYFKFLSLKMYAIQGTILASAKVGIKSVKYSSCQWPFWDLNLSYLKG